MIKSSGRLHLLWWLTNNGVVWSLVVILYRCCDSGVLHVLLYQNVGFSSRNRGLNFCPSPVFVATTFLISFAAKNKIMPPIEIQLQSAQLRIGLVKVGVHALYHIPCSIPLGLHVLRQHDHHVFHYPVVIYFSTVSFGG